MLNKCKKYIITRFKPQSSWIQTKKMLQKIRKNKFNFTILNKIEQKRQFFETYILYIYVSDN